MTVGVPRHPSTPRKRCTVRNIPVSALSFSCTQARSANLSKRQPLEQSPVSSQPGFLPNLGTTTAEGLECRHAAINCWTTSDGPGARLESAALCVPGEPRRPGDTRSAIQVLHGNIWENKAFREGEGRIERGEDMPQRGKLWHKVSNRVTRYSPKSGQNLNCLHFLEMVLLLHRMKRKVTVKVSKGKIVIT
jgi:hypothetical protein